MHFPNGATVTILSVTTTDDGLGNTSEETVTYEWGPCMVAPRSSAESADASVPRVITGISVYGPPIDVDPADLALDSDDRLVIDGVTYEVEGHVGTWPWPAGGVAGVEVAARRAGAV